MAIIKKVLKVLNKCLKRVGFTVFQDDKFY